MVVWLVVDWDVVMAGRWVVGWVDMMVLRLVDLKGYGLALRWVDALAMRGNK